MINVIRHGDRKRVTCPFCACIFTYERDDVYTDGGMNEWECRVLCPDCGEACQVDSLDYHTK